MSDHFDEPVPDHLADTGQMRAIDPLADTNPMGAIPDHLADTGQMRAVRDTVPWWGRAVGCVSLLGALVLTTAAVYLLVAPDESAPPLPAVPPNQADAPLIPTLTMPPPTTIPPTVAETVGETVETVVILPTLDPNAMVSLLAAPPVRVAAAEIDYETVRNPYNPFTIIPERPRSEVEVYTIAQGDTIFGIAERYGLQPESIVWANGNSIVEGLRPGRDLYILPVDGVYHEVIQDQPISEIAAAYRVDAFAIIESEYNQLFGATPDTLLPSGTRVVVPGGTREQISWAPTVERVGGDGTSGGGGGAQISFAPGDPGSCGLVENVGGGGWAAPVAGYEWIRGFTGYHSGVDLSASVGTPVFAANSGNVIFAGWSNWGYGYTVVLAHGPYTTLYGHLSSIAVGCGQYASAGTVIGAVGTSGNSSGPHLHFEVRYFDTPIDPTLIMPF